MRTGASGRSTADRKSATNRANCPGESQFRAKTIKPSGLLARKKSYSPGSSRSPAQPNMTARGLLDGLAERGSVGDNEAADVHGFQLPAHAFGLSAVGERADTHAVPNALGAEINANHNAAQPG